MFQLFSVYNQNLSQLSVRLLLQKIDINSNSLTIEIWRKSIKLLVKCKQISIQFKDCIELDPISVRQLNGIQLIETENKSIELWFTLSARMGLYSIYYL